MGIIMSEKQFVCIDVGYGDDWYITDNGKRLSEMEIVDLLNEQQELIEELQVSDEMGWKRAEHFEKKCPKELHNKKMYIKRLEYKVQKFKEENEQLKIANARWLDKSLQDRQIRYSNTNHKELTKKYLQLQEENERLRKQLDFYLLDEFEWKEKYGDVLDE